MSGLFTFKFWGIGLGRDRELLGMMNGESMADAVDVLAVALAELNDLASRDYVEIIIENAGRAP